MPELRTNTLRLTPSSATEATLRVLGERVSRLWNAGNYLCRQAFVKGKPLPSYATLCKRLPVEHPADYSAVPSDVAQETLKKLCEAWKSFRALRKAFAAGKLEHKPGLVAYRKHKDGTRPFDFIPIKSARSYSVRHDAFELTLPADLRTKGRLSMKYVGCERYQGVCKRAEVMWDNTRRRWYVKYAVEVAPKVISGSSRAAAIDLGVRIAASLSIEGVEQARHFSARELLKDWDYWGRQIAQHMQALCSRGKKASRRLSRLYAMRSARWRHAWLAIAREIATTCRRQCVGVVYLGWPKGIREACSYNRKWAGRIHNFWGFDAASKLLQAALERQGVLVKRVGERGSSSTCPSCGSKDVVRKPRYVLTCKACATKMHADQVGSRNILKFNEPRIIWDAVKATAKPDTRRWNKQRWADASNRSSIQELLLAA